LKALNQLSRKEIHAFHSWLRTLPFNEILFMRSSYDTEAVREQKLKDLYIKYNKEKIP
jgi:hypothetical protein